MIPAIISRRFGLSFANPWRFRAKRNPVRVKKTRQIKIMESRFHQKQGPLNRRLASGCNANYL
jgi:hypothetical protein